MPGTEPLSTTSCGAQELGLALPAVVVAEEVAVLEPAVEGALYASNSGENRIDITNPPTLTVVAVK